MLCFYFGDICRHSKAMKLNLLSIYLNTHFNTALIYKKIRRANSFLIDGHEQILERIPLGSVQHNRKQCIYHVPSVSPWYVERLQLRKRTAHIPLGSTGAYCLRYF